MKIKRLIWNLYCKIAGLLAAPFAVLDILRPNWWSETAQHISLGLLFLLGFSGVLMAILTRTGTVEFTYSEKDKKGIDYKISKIIAKQEKNSSVGNLYSEKYYKKFSEKTGDKEK
jgi:hypothetical protein